MHFVLLIVLFGFAVQAQAEKCYTPNKEEGLCISLYSCPALIQALANQPDPSTVEFVQQSNCGGTPHSPLVCCGSSPNFTGPQKNVTKKSLLPNRRICGLQHSDDFFHTEEGDTQLTEFPWLARIMNEQDSVCTGSLINHRYVLTAANCVENAPKGVRLGEYHIYNETDCIGTECSNPVEDFAVEKTIVHSNYNPNVFKYNIALLRLSRKVEYSDYIRPICLPFPGTIFATVGELLTTTGWNLYGHKVSPTKQKNSNILMSNETCTEVAQFWMKKKENFICTRELRNLQLRCDGDRGGPVMFSHNEQWHQEGIIVRNYCGLFVRPGSRSSLPEEHTKVADYLDWIEENIEP